MRDSPSVHSSVVPEDSTCRHGSRLIAQPFAGTGFHCVSPKERQLGEKCQGEEPPSHRVSPGNNDHLDGGKKPTSRPLSSDQPRNLRPMIVIREMTPKEATSSASQRGCSHQTSSQPPTFSAWRLFAFEDPTPAPGSARGRVWSQHLRRGGLQTEKEKRRGSRWGGGGGGPLRRNNSDEG